MRKSQSIIMIYHHIMHSKGWKMFMTMDCLLGVVTCLLIITGSVALVVTSGGPVTTFVGGQSEMTCSFSPTNSQGSSFAWSFDGQNGHSSQIGTCDITQCTPANPARHQLVKSADNDMGRMKLIVFDTVSSDVGNYTCLVSTSEDAQSALVKLNVTECSVHHPTIDCPGEVSISSFMDLSCSYLTPDQSPSKLTRIANIYLTDSLETPFASVPNFDIYVNVSRQSIPNVTEVATGLRLTSICCRSESSLTCRAPDGQNLCSDVCITNVLYPPSDIVLTQSPPEPWQEGSQDASILCQSNGFPSPTVAWRRVLSGGLPGEVLANGTGMSRLSFPEIQRHLAGVYRCEADNHMESKEIKTKNISVQYPPHIDRRVSVVHSDEGTVAVLSCIVDSNPSTTSMITWSTPNQSPIATNVTRHSETELESRLVFTEKVHRGVYGNYTCTAINALGRDSFVIQLTGYCYPDPPYNLRVVSFSDTSLTLSWSPGQDGGLPVTFVFSYCVNVTQTERCRKEQGVTDQQFTLDGLNNYTIYRITVLAENDIGSSGNVDIFASTAPGTVDDIGISATYEMKSGRLDISSTDSDTSDLCIHAEYHVGGLRNRNETCLLPGQTVYIRNGAREHQLWLVVCGRGVCSASSRVKYLENSDERWSLLFILVITLGGCLGVTVLVLLFFGSYRLISQERRSWNSLDSDGMSTIQRALPIPPACALAIGIGSSSLRKDDDTEINYDAIENIKGKEISDNQRNASINASKNTTTQSTTKSPQDDVFPRTLDGYMKMDAGKTTIPQDQGTYTTQLHSGLNAGKEPEAFPYGYKIDQSSVTSMIFKDVDLPRIEVNNDTYAVAERNKETVSDYMVPTSPGCDVQDTAM
ncbi:uncharacterized protein LOC115918953 [Strongylocentrotus purpuratus]|uniref:Uncharacterized protein n=1 Tax=Strongylocentrotus purpuratus TaxID=7668 RepID=A0A7M7T3K8_STRPU|nr:uncharacterized protein LOC115918953 [Strongylocentrotus purpuratus]|eukprot:XP_003728288.1 PREDICTED: uncharacterized protein LOC100888723 [Strongylocentrotus purpuratus]